MTLHKIIRKMLMLRIDYPIIQYVFYLWLNQVPFNERLEQKTINCERQADR